jgi:hypothetical protein
LRIHKAIGASDAKQRRSYKLKEVRFAADLFLEDRTTGVSGLKYET